MLRKSTPTLGKLLGASAMMTAAFAPMLQAQSTLQILHASDLEGGVDAVVDAPNFAAVVEALEQQAADAAVPSILLSAGDNYLPGPFLSAAGDGSLRAVLQSVYQDFYGEAGLTNIREGGGRVDIAIMNILGFDASAVGNHEFDLGPTFFADLVAPDIRGGTLGDVRWLGTQFPYLSSNLDFSGDGDLSGLFTTDILPNTDFAFDFADLAASAAAPGIAQATTIDADGEIIGIVGVTPTIVETISSTGDVVVTGPDDNDMEELADEIQPVIDALVLDGVDKIILVTHLQQIALEKELIELLSGVDVIIAGGSDTLQADGNDILRPGDVADETYPFVTTNLDGDPAIIVSTDGEYSYVGRLVVSFDANGVVIPGLLDDSLNGAYASIDDVVEDLWGNLVDPFLAGTKGDYIATLTQAVLDVVIEKDSEIFGESVVWLEGRRAFVRTEETNLGNLTADANLWYIHENVDSTVVASIKNGGGIRAEIGSIDGDNGDLLPTEANPLSGKEAGEISALDIENTLRFNNSLALVTLTLEDFVAVLEHAVSATEIGATPGQFPQIGGFNFSFDPSLAPGSRVLTVALKDENAGTTLVIMEDGEFVADPTDTIRVVTLGFLAGGGDSYPFDTLGTNIVDTGVGEQTAMQEFLEAMFPVGDPFTNMELPVSQDPRIQNLWYRSDTAAYPPVVEAGVPQLTPIGFYETGLFDESAAEIVSYDPESERLFLVNAFDGSVDILDMSDPTNPIFISQIDIQEIFGTDSITAEPNSVAVCEGLVAVAVARENDNNGNPMTGYAAFFDINGELLAETEVGYLPDMITFTPNGRFVLTANEGEPNDDYTFDPEGSVSVMNVNFLKNRLRLIERRPELADRLRFIAPRARHATFERFELPFFQRRFDLSDVRMFGPGASLAEDLEPEYITVSDDSRFAYVTLQENNAIATISVFGGRVVAINPLGFKDWEESAFDASNRDDMIDIRPWPVYGMYQPDAIASWQTGSGFRANTYLITANEGDARDYDGFSEEERIKDIVLDPTAFPNAAELQENENLGRLNITTTLGDRDNDGDFDALYAYGARSFSIWEVGRRNTISQIYDSGDQLEQITAALNPEFFNSTNDESEFDSRSDDKGPEPEGITIGHYDNRVYAFIGLERIGGIMVYDVTTPRSPEFIQYINTRDFLADPESSEAGDRKSVV